MINLHIALAYKYLYLPDALFHMDNRRFAGFQRYDLKKDASRTVSHCQLFYSSIQRKHFILLKCLFIEFLLQ